MSMSLKDLIVDSKGKKHGFDFLAFEAEKKRQIEAKNTEEVLLEVQKIVDVWAYHTERLNPESTERIALLKQDLKQLQESYREEYLESIN
jgi:hypothetical protein